MSSKPNIPVKSSGDTFSAQELNTIVDFFETKPDADELIPGPEGPQGIQGPEGSKGDDGKSAYDIAVSNGFVGTEQEWLESLSPVRYMDGDIFEGDGETPETKTTIKDDSIGEEKLSEEVRGKLDISAFLQALPGYGVGKVLTAVSHGFEWVEHSGGGGGDTEIYDVYISSSGSDSNDGLTLSTPVASIEKLTEVSSTFGDGVKIKFLDEVKYREELDLRNLNDVEFDGGYSVLDASDIVTETWTQPDASTYPNVWKVTWPVDAPIREGYTMIIDGEMPNVVSSIALCNSTANSFHMPNGFVNGSGPIEIYVNSGSNPNTDGKQHEIMSRQTGLRLGNNAVVSNVITQLQSENDGSTVLGINALVQKSLFAFGHKHNVFIGSGTMEDCIIFDAEFSPSAGPFIGYMNDPSGHSVHWKRCFAILPKRRANGSASFHAHGAPGKSFDTFSIEECISINLFSSGGLNAGVSAPVFRNNYSACYGMDSNIGPMLMERCLYKPYDKGAIEAYLQLELRNNAYWITTGASTGVIQVKNTSTSLVLDHCTFAGPVAFSRGFLDPYSSSNVDYSFTFCVFLLKGENMNKMLGSTYAGDYNVFFTNDGASDNARFSWEGQTATNLSMWQYATGQDANSVYVTSAQQMAFFLNDPSTGDFRINPNAQVTRSDGTVYTGTFPDGTPLTECGVQEHWNFNTREIINTPPIKWPTPPMTYEESVEYIKNPEGWDFYE